MRDSARGKRPSAPPLSPIDAREIDARYGLEPVFEPGHSEELSEGSLGIEACTVQCPYCGECFETALDLSAGSAHYLEDCRICCQPIEFDLEVDAAGKLRQLAVGRGD